MKTLAIIFIILSVLVFTFLFDVKVGLKIKLTKPKKGQQWINVIFNDKKII